MYGAKKYTTTHISQTAIVNTLEAVLKSNSFIYDIVELSGYNMMTSLACLNVLTRCRLVTLMGSGCRDRRYFITELGKIVWAIEQGRNMKKVYKSS